MKEIYHPDDRIEAKLVFDQQRVATVVVSTIVDSSAELCAANEIIGLPSSNFKAKHKKSGIKFALVKKINDHSWYYATRRAIPILGVSDRENRTKIILHRDFRKVTKMSDIYIDCSDTDDLTLTEAVPVNTGSVFISAHTVWHFESLKPIGDVPQTRVTSTSRIDFKGLLPSFWTKKANYSIIHKVSELRRKFDKSKVIDKIQRSLTIKKLGMIKTFTKENFDGELKDIGGNERVESLTLTLAQAHIKEEGEGKIWGRATLRIKASLEETAAFFWNVESEAFKGIDGSERTIEKTGDEWEVIVRKVQKLESMHKGRHRKRYFKSTMRLLKVDINVYIIKLEPSYVPDKEPNEEDVVTKQPSRVGALMSTLAENTPLTKKLSTVRRVASALRSRGPIAAKEETIIRLTKRGEHTTKVELVSRLDLGPEVR